MLALCAGGLAAWLSQRHIQARIDLIDADARASRASVVVAATDLKPGARLTAETVAVREIPIAWLPSGALTPEQFSGVESSVLAHPLKRGESVLWVHIESGRGGSLSERIAEGRRAITIPVDEINSVSGLLEPGDLVDLYVSFDHRGKRVTMPMLQKMKVLATGQQVDAPGAAGGDPLRGFSTLTLDAAPDEALKLIAARDGGVITAMLRRPGDARPVDGRTTGDLAALMGLDEKPELRARPHASSRVAVIYGDRPLRGVPRLGAPLPAEFEALSLLPADPVGDERLEDGDAGEEAGVDPIAGKAPAQPAKAPPVAGSRS